MLDRARNQSTNIYDHSDFRSDGSESYLGRKWDVRVQVSPSFASVDIQSYPQNAPCFFSSIVLSSQRLVRPYFRVTRKNQPAGIASDINL